MVAHCKVCKWAIPSKNVP